MKSKSVRESVCACVSVNVYMYVCVREKERDCVCVCVLGRERLKRRVGNKVCLSMQFKISLWRWEGRGSSSFISFGTLKKNRIQAVISFESWSKMKIKICAKTVQITTIR